MPTSAFAREKMQGFEVGLDARDFQDQLRGTGFECKAKQYVLPFAEYPNDWWRVQYSFDDFATGVGFGTRSCLGVSRAWRSAIICSNPRCYYHAVTK
jgi:hypothetical protein